MIHNFVSNDNKGNVNSVKVTSEHTYLGNKDFIVNLTIDPEEAAEGSLNGTMDRTAREITDAINSGLDVMFVFTNAGPIVGFNVMVRATVYTKYYSSAEEVSYDLISASAIIPDPNNMAVWQIFSLDNNDDDMEYHAVRLTSA